MQRKTPKTEHGHSPKSSAVKQIIKLKTDNPNMSLRAIGKTVGRDHSTVKRALDRYKIDTKHVSEYNLYKADMLAGVQDKILSSMVDDDKIKKASLRDSAIAYGTLYDKQRLEEGKSTQNIELAGVVELVDRAEREKLKNDQG